MSELPSSHKLWMIVAIIQPFKLDAVALALGRMRGFHGMTVTDVRGSGGGSEPAFGDDAPEADSARLENIADVSPHLRLEIAVAGHSRAVAIVEAISLTAHTGRSGDGKVFLWALDQVLSIRSFRINRDAL